MASKTFSAGSDLVDRPSVDGWSNYYSIATNTPINEDGRLTQWKIFAKRPLPIQLVIYRRSGDSFTVVGKSAMETAAMGLNTFSLGKGIDVKKGDLVGWHNPQAGVIAFVKDNGPWNFGNLSGTVVFTNQNTGETSLAGSSNRQYSIEVIGEEEPTSRWVSASGGSVPSGAVVAGHEADGTPLYVARAATHDGLHPGKVRPAFGAANIPYGGQEIKVNPYEVLVGEATWESARDGRVPDGAIVAGYEADGAPLFVARAHVHDGLHPGKVRLAFRAANIPWGGAEEKANPYEVLVAR